MQTPSSPRSSVPAQRGVATLFMTIVLLLVAGLVMLYTSRGAVMEQHLSGNEIRAKQAFAAANAGLDHAIAYMRVGGLDHDLNGVVDTINATTLTVTGGTVSTYAVAYCDSGAAAPTCATAPGAPACAAPADPALTLAVSCGWSDDNSAVQRVTQLLQGSPSFGGNLATPLITRGTADLLVGGASVFNYFDDLTVWSGGSMLGQSMTGKTFIRDTVSYPDASATLDTDNDGTPDFRDTGTSPGCNNPPTGYTCSTQGSTLGHDTVGGDTNLSSLTSDQFFQLFFGTTPTTYRDATAGWVVDLNNSLTNENSTAISSIDNMSGQVIWLEGNASLSASDISGTIGSPTKPVILVVNGNLDLGGNVDIYGIVYVSGDVTGNGSPNIYGSMIVSGSANITGNPKIVYDPSAIINTSDIGLAGKLQGSWKDW